MDLFVGAAIVVLTALFVTAVLMGFAIWRQGGLRGHGSRRRHSLFADDGRVRVEYPVLVGLTHAGGKPIVVLCRVDASHDVRRSFISGASNFIFNRKDWNRLVDESRVPDLVVDPLTITVSPEELRKLFTTYKQYISKSREAATRAGP